MLSRFILLLTLPLAWAGTPDGYDFWWTALGDSYASGVGSGTYTGGRRCLRYDKAYPAQMQGNNQLGSGTTPEDKRLFQNVVCSGAEVDDIENWQLLDDDTSSQPSRQYGDRPRFGEPQVATLTVGGDDIDFPGILFNCIIESHVWGGPPFRTCDDQKTHSWDLIKDPKLVDNISDLIAKIVEKGRAGQAGDKFMLYVTGYGQFFNSDTTLCNEVTFARTANPKPDGKEHIKMTTELRSEFNSMSLGLNNAIKAAVARHVSDGVKYIDIDAALKGHRFCEEGINEPDQKNPSLWLWHYPYNEPNPATVSRSDASTYQEVIDEANSETFGGLSVAQLSQKFNNGGAVNDAWFNAINQSQIEGGVDATGFWDGVIGYRAKLFHPQVPWHNWIQSAIVDQWKADREVDSNQAPTPKLTCSGVDNTHWMGRNALNNVIPTFCEDAEKQGVQDKGSGSLVRKYNQGGPDAVTLSMDWPSGADFKPKKDDCVGFLTTVMDSCDGNDPDHNPLNWKHGGYSQVGDVRYNVFPTAQRYKAGTCSMHVHQEEFFAGSDGPGTSRHHTFYLRVLAKDSDGKTVADVDNDVEAGDGNPLNLKGYYNDLVMTPEARGDYIQFALGDQYWRTTDKDGNQRCKVGGWDSDYSPVGRDMDCWFFC